MSDFIPRKDDDAIAWCRHFLATLNRDPASFGLTAEDLIFASEKLSSSSASLSAALRAQKLALGAVSAKNSDRRSLEQEVRSLVKRINSDRNVSDDVKTTAGMHVKRRIHRSPLPQSPLALSAAVELGGITRLKWNGNNNRPGTFYVIEMFTADSGAWKIIDVETSTKYVCREKHPGQRVGFRVTAKRGGVASSPSREVIVNPAAEPIAA